jgi:pilus assembly protein Flp/PilA
MCEGCQYWSAFNHYFTAAFYPKRIGRCGNGSRRLLRLGNDMMNFRKLFSSNKGATAIEYGLIAALIAVAAVSAMGTLGNKIALTMNNSANDMKVS